MAELNANQKAKEKIELRRMKIGYNTEICSICSVFSGRKANLMAHNIVVENC